MRAYLRLGLGLALLLASPLGCSGPDTTFSGYGGGNGSGSGNGNGSGVRDGGAVRSDGSASDSGNGNSNGGCLPDCLANLLESCPPGGTCTLQSTVTTNPSGVISNVCYSNGVKMSSILNSTLIRTTTTRNGAVCYSAETPITTGSSTTNTTTYKNGTGTVVATVTIDRNHPTNWQVSCGGTSFEVDYGSPACRPNTDAGTNTCFMGSCP